MKIALIYFSGSGNTNIVVSKYEESLKNLGFEVSKFNIENSLDKIPNLDSFYKVGFFYPIHGFNSPNIVVKFAKKIEKSTSKRNYFVVMVSGEPLNLNHSSNSRLIRVLKKKNYYLESEYHYVLGYNLVFRHTEEKAYRMYDVMEKIIPLDTKEYFVENKTNKLKRVFLGSFLSFLLRIQFPFYKVNGKLFRINNKKCIKCMMCMNNCPVHNITYSKDKFHFSSKCLMCARCSFSCPKDAVRIGILNFWRVNGKYKYKPTSIQEVDKHSRYCKKSFKRYFDKAEERINKAQ